MNDKILIVVSNYYNEISDNLLEGAKEILQDNKFEYDIIEAPGCYEIPLLIKKILVNIKVF
tara:strand:- start:339 stop:521 length:183 start_codon:yes stop_codon:yes gene_type:complete